MVDPTLAQSTHCIFCNPRQLAISDDYQVECALCGRYLFEGLLTPRIVPDHERVLLRGYTREHSEVRGKPAELTCSNCDGIVAQSPHTVRGKAGKLLV
jgi:hypothetical protein